MDELLRENLEFNSSQQQQYPPLLQQYTSGGGNSQYQQPHQYQTQTPNTVSSESSNNVMGDLDPLQFPIVDSMGGNSANESFNQQGTGVNFGSSNAYNTHGNNSSNTNNNLRLTSDYKDDFLSPTASYSNDNNFGIFGVDTGAGGNTLGSTNNINNQNNNTHNYDPLMDDGGFQLLQQTQYVNPNIPAQFSLPLGLPSQRILSSFVNPMTTTNLDEIISPNNHNTNINSSFLNPQYFSPPTRNSNFNSLNPIAEDNFNFTPSVSRHGSISIPYNTNGSNNNNQNISQSHSDGLGFSALIASTIGGVGTSAGYLSPSNYMSPLANVNSLDVLRSPSYGVGSGSYLNSPPDFHVTMADNSKHANSSAGMSVSNSLSIPSTINDTSNSGKQQLGTSPSSTGGKQLTKEEKIKRRREFHNAVERRRRDLIKERIKDLGVLVPPSLLNPQLSAVQAFQRNVQYNSREINEMLSNVKAKETKPNKSTILNKSVHYVQHLEYVLEQQQKAREELELKIQKMEQEIGNLSFTPSSIQSSIKEQSSSHPQSQLQSNDMNINSIGNTNDFTYDSYNDDLQEFGFDSGNNIDNTVNQVKEESSTPNLFNADDFLLDELTQPQQAQQLGSDFYNI